MKSKKKKANLKTQFNHINPNKVLNNTNFLQPKVEKQKKNPPKNKKQNFENEKEKEREITFCEWENYGERERCSQHYH